MLSQGTPLPLYLLSSSPPVTAPPSYLPSGVENQPFYALPGSAYSPSPQPMLLMIPSGAGAFSITFEPKEPASSSAFNRAALVDFSTNGSGVSPGCPDYYPTQNPNGQHSQTTPHNPTTTPAQRPPSPAHSTRSNLSYANAPRNSTASETRTAGDTPATTNTSTADSNPPAPAPPTTNTGSNAPPTRTKRKTFYSSELHRVKMYGIEREFTEWYESHGEHARPAPPAPIRKLVASCPRAVRTGRLHLHRHDGGVQAWMWVVPAPERERGGLKGERGEARWAEVEAGKAHPRMEGHVLHFLDDGEPRWVKELTASQYAAQAGRRKRARAAVGRED